MSEVRKVDTDLATMIHTMKLQPEKDSIVMVDVEANNPNTSDLQRLRIFDFAYGAFNPVSGEIGEITNNLIYEGMIHPEVIDQIINWKKIRYASFDSYYGLFNLLVQNDWWSDRVFPRDEISDEAVVKFKQETRERLYNAQRRLLPEQKRVLRVWETERAHYKNASENIAKRKAEIKKIVQSIKDLTELLLAEEEVEGTIQSGGLIGNPLYDKIMGSVYMDLYKDQYERINWQGDLAFFKEVEKTMNVNFHQDIARWGDFITTFDNKLKNNKNLLGITAYNLRHEQRSVRSMVEDFGPSEEYASILDGERYNSTCMYNMMGLISKQEVGDIINGLHSYDDKFFVKRVAEAFKDTGALKTQSFELFYKNTFPTSEYKQKHTAKEDVLDQEEAFVEAFQKYIVPSLEKRR